MRCLAVSSWATWFAVTVNLNPGSRSRDPMEVPVPRDRCRFCLLYLQHGGPLVDDLPAHMISP